MKFIVTVVCVAIMFASPAAADDGSDVDAGTTEGGLIADAVSESTPGSHPSSGDAHSSSDVEATSIQLGQSGCPGAIAVSQATDEPVSFCQQYAEPSTRVLTVGLIRTAFAELKLPAGDLVIQPPDGLTLVNFDTNFYTTSTEPIARTVTLLGHRVTLEATPSTFHWTFGDGERLSTSDPGAPYPRLRVTHNYLRKDTYRPSLATTYTGRYRIDGGPWRQIPGTVTIDGAGRPLRVIEAEPKLVSY